MTATNKSKCIAATLLVSLWLGGAAQAQYYYGQPQPLYPYEMQPQYVQPQLQYAPQAYPYVRTPHVKPALRAQSKTDPALVEELRKGRKKKPVAADNNEKCDDCDKDVKIDKKVVVRGKPIVRKHIRVVDKPPIVVQREIDLDSGQVVSQHRVPPAQASLPHGGGSARVIHAEAEVTILGPDRMSIRLYRKNDGRDANAKAPAAKSKKLKTSKTEKSQPQT